MKNCAIGRGVTEAARAMENRPDVGAEAHDSAAFRLFILAVARMNWDGEQLPDGSEYSQENDDARDTLMSLITWARELLDTFPQETCDSRFQRHP